MLDVNLGGKDIVLGGLYRTPTRKNEPNYFSQLIMKDELINLITWAMSQRNTLILMADLNLDELKPHKIEYKILKNIEESFDLTCLIKRATRVTATSRSLINVIMRLRKLIPLQTKLQIYKSAVLPYFNYCSLVWHFCKAGYRDKLERINERGLRVVFCERRASYSHVTKF